MSIINSSKNQDQSITRPCHLQDSYWDLICSASRVEKSYFKGIPGGWLLRHLFFKNKQFASSSIVFFPDSKEAWKDLEFDVNWEHINTKSNSNFKLILERLKVPEGWVVKEFLTTKPVYSYNEGVMEINLTYIPDPNHEWQI